MEDFTATTSYPLARVLKLVRETDAYVVIVAWRYGFVPSVDGVEGLPSGPASTCRSITEWEYLAAKDKPEPLILPFILSDTAPWPPQNMDGFVAGTTAGTGSLEPVQTFRALLMREHVVSFFAGPQELEALVGAAITTTRLSRQVLINRIARGSPVQGVSTIPDSHFAGGIIQAVRDAGTERVVTIDIATGWWSTRLYLLALLLDRLTGAQRLLVLDGKRFVGLLSLRSIIRVIPSLHDQIARFEAALRERSASESDLIREAEALLQLFQSVFPTATEAQVKVDITESNLARWFDESMITTPINVDNIQRASPLDLIRLFDYPSDFVPVVVGADDDSPEQVRPVHVIDKPALSVQLARSYVSDLLDKVRS